MKEPSDVPMRSETENRTDVCRTIRQSVGKLVPAKAEIHFCWHVLAGGGLRGAALTQEAKPQYT